MTEMLRKTENVAKNLANENSQDLTEQWKKGELPEGYYYVKDGENMIAEYLDGYFYNNGEPMTSFSGGVDEILAPVPTFEEWQALKEYERIVTSYNMKPIDYDIACETVNKLLDERKALKEQNAQLKEKCERLEKQLRITIEALDKVAIYMTCDEKEIREIQPDFCADQAALDAVNEAMDKIKELENKNKNKIFTYMGKPIDTLTYIEKKIEYERKELEK